MTYNCDDAFGSRTPVELCVVVIVTNQQYKTMPFYYWLANAVHCVDGAGTPDTHTHKRPPDKQQWLLLAHTHTNMAISITILST